MIWRASLGVLNLPRTIFTTALVALASVASAVAGESVVLHIWMSHVTDIDESCNKHEWKTSHVRMWHVTHHNYIGACGAGVGSVGGGRCVSHVTHLNDLFICVTWLIDVCDKTPWYVWHDSSICVTWLIHMWDWIHSCVTWIHAFLCFVPPQVDKQSVHQTYAPGMHTHMHESYLTQTAFMFLICIAPTRYVLLQLDMHHGYAHINESFICVTWLIHMCDMTHSYIAPTRYAPRIRTHKWVMSHTDSIHVPHMYCSN